MAHDCQLTLQENIENETPECILNYYFDLFCPTEKSELAACLFPATKIVYYMNKVKSKLISLPTLKANANSIKIVFWISSYLSWHKQNKKPNITHEI